MLNHVSSANGEIPEFYVFFQIEENGDGIVATQFAGVLLPLVTNDASMIEEMKIEAQEVADANCKRIVLAKFSVREDIWFAEPAICREGDPEK